MTNQPTQQEQTQTLTYEFTPAQNDTIRVLASRMKFVGIINIIVGVVYLFVGFGSLMVKPLLFIVYVPFVFFFVIVGIWSVNAAASFRSIVYTKGQDIPYLMTALDALRKLYNLQFWLMIVACGIVLIAVLIGVFAGMSNGIF